MLRLDRLQSVLIGAMLAFAVMALIDHIMPPLIE